MLSSIHPLGEAGRGNRYEVTAGAFLVGSILGAVCTAALAGLVGLILIKSSTAVLGSGWTEAGALAFVIAVGLMAVLAQATGRPLPSIHRQVNENWLNEFRGWVYGLGFGAQLGCGVVTYIRSAALYVWLAAMMAVGNLLVAVALGALFGVVRGSSIFATRSVGTPDDLMAFHRRLHSSPNKTEVHT